MFENPQQPNRVRIRRNQSPPPAKRADHPRTTVGEFVTLYSGAAKPGADNRSAFRAPEMAPHREATSFGIFALVSSALPSRRLRHAGPAP